MGGWQAALGALARDCRLNQVMVEAAIRGSIGSACILMRILKGRVFLEVLDTVWLTPAWDPEEPDRLCLRGGAVQGSGGGAGGGWDMRGSRRQADVLVSCGGGMLEAETWFVPQVGWVECRAFGGGFGADAFGMGWGSCRWYGSGTCRVGWGVDGACTFRAAVETGIEIDYQLSQAGRGLKYSSDPTLLIKEPAGLEGELVRGAGNALVVSEKGDARLLEIGGTAAGAVLDYVRMLRELALEGVHGNRAEASRMTAPASGRALEMMNQGLIWLADNLRVSYGEGGLLPLCRMMLRASARYPLRVGGVLLEGLDAEAPVGLVWPPWYPASSEDRARDAATLMALEGAKFLDPETVRRWLDDDWGAVQDRGSGDVAGAVG